MATKEKIKADSKFVMTAGSAMDEMLEQGKREDDCFYKKAF